MKSLKDFKRQEGTAKFRVWLKVVTASKVNRHYQVRGKQPLAIGGSTILARIGEIEGADSDSDGEDPALAHSEESFLVQRTLQLLRNEFGDHKRCGLGRVPGRDRSRNYDLPV